MKRIVIPIAKVMVPAVREGELFRVVNSDNDEGLTVVLEQVRTCSTCARRNGTHCWTAPSDGMSGIDPTKDYCSRYLP